MYVLDIPVIVRNGIGNRVQTLDKAVCISLPTNAFRKGMKLLVVWQTRCFSLDFVGFYGISTTEGYLIPNPLYTFI